MINKNFLLFIFLIVFSTSFAQEKANVKYWIFFKDKGEFKPDVQITKDSPAYEKGKELLTERAIKRRLKVLAEDNLIDFADLPLDENYVNGIKKLGIDLIAQSRWLNGVSAYMTSSQLEKVKGQDYVSQIKVVNKLYKQEMKSGFERDLESNSDTGKDILKYGNSLKQLETVNVPKVHAMGITGKGVLIASFDDGFDWKNHEALRNLKVVGEYDFINEDENTFYDLNQRYKDEKKQGEHGTATLSSMSGYKEGKLIGPAFDSEILLAKTEYVPTETPMEEDFFLEAAEWAEAKGADVITSSLIYKEYDDPYQTNSYTYKDFDGDIPVTSFAGDRATYLGIVVCQSMGNYYQTSPPSLGSAADGDSVISVGAISYDGNPANFTSNGPTSDGQMKPDVVAPGVGVYVAVVKEISGNDSTYQYSSGTSFSTPITAGIVALILSVHPELTPMQVRDALRSTSSKSKNPDNILGWGNVNAYDAMLFHGMAWSNDFEIVQSGSNIVITTYLASKNSIDQNSVKIHYSFDNGDTYKEEIIQLVESNGDANNSGKYSVTLNGSSDLNSFKAYFSAEDMNGNKSTHPKEVSSTNY